MTNIFKYRYFHVILTLTFLLPAVLANAQLIAVSGNYTGTGNNNNAISGLGFKPDLVIINSGIYHAQMTTATLPVNSTKDMSGGAVKTGLIKSLDNDGFTLDDDNKVNRSGTDYYYLALKTEAGVLEMGSYTGNNVDNRNITGTSFKPDMVIIISEDNNKKPVFSSYTMGADESMNFLNSGTFSNRIQTLNSNGFQVGKKKEVNESGITYHYIAIKNSSGKTSIGSYTGDGTNNRIISSAGAGTFVMVKRSGDNAVHRNGDMAVNNSYYFKNSASVADRIKKNSVTGFELGDNNDVNQSGKEYHYLKLIGLNTILPVSLISFDIVAKLRKVELDWNLANAQHIVSFRIERSDDRGNHQFIGEVMGNFNNTASSTYRFTDTDPLNGYSYYRLYMIKDNGDQEYSEIKKVFYSPTAGNEFTVYPNPVIGSNFSIEQTQPEPVIYLDIIDNNGLVVDTCVLYAGSQKIYLKNRLKPGIYNLIGNNGKTILFRKKIVKL